MASNGLEFNEALGLYQKLLSASNVGFVLLNLQFEIQHANEQAQKMLKLTGQSGPFLKCIDLPNTEKTQKMLQLIIEKEHVSDWEMDLYNQDEHLHVYITGQLIEDYIVLMLKPLEESVQRLQEIMIQVNSELTNSNRELARKQALLQKANHKINEMHHALSEKNELMKQDLKMAKIVQKALLEKVTLPNKKVVIEKVYHPAASIGGDLYDVVNINEHLSGILICDVSGHGVASALVMAVLKNIFRNHAKDYEQPHLFLEKMNREFLEIFGSQSMDLYATALYLIIDTSNHQLHYAGAGHPYPCYYSPEATEELIAPGFPIGLFDQGDFKTHTRTYTVHDRLLLYTDGFSEYAERLSGEAVDMCRFTWGTIKTVFKQFAQDLKAQAHPQTDDVCMMIIEFEA